MMVKVGRFIKHSATPNRAVINQSWPSKCGTTNTPEGPFRKKKRKHVDDHKDHQQDDTHDDDNVDDEDDADDDDDHDDDYDADEGNDDCEGGVDVGGRGSSDDDDDYGDDGDDDGTRSQHISNVSNKTRRKRSRDTCEYVKGKLVSFAKTMLFR